MSFLPPARKPTVAEAAIRLAELRDSGSRDSVRVCTLGELILTAPGGIKSLPKKEETWAILGQLALAAFDCGRNDLARVCVDRLDKKFPDSGRVKPLQGMLLESDGRYELARLFYEKELLKDENNIALRKRLISLHLNYSEASTSETPAKLSKQSGVELLVQHLDTVYTDVEGWLELAEVYSSSGLYSQALSAIGELILMQPQNPFYVLRHAETAYTTGDLELAYRSYLRVLELSGKEGIQKGGVARRAAVGIKLCVKRLQGTGMPGSTAPSANSISATPSPQRLDDVDLIVTEALLEAYSTEWNKAGDKAAGHNESQAFKKWLANLSSSEEIKR